MFGEHHDIAAEFPQYKAIIHELKLTNARFKQLYEAYQAVDKEVFRIEEQIETRSQAETEKLKMKRVHLKDQLYAIIKIAAGV